VTIQKCDLTPSDGDTSGSEGMGQNFVMIQSMRSKYVNEKCTACMSLPLSAKLIALRCHQLMDRITGKQLGPQPVVRPPPPKKTPIVKKLTYNAFGKALKPVCVRTACHVMLSAVQSQAVSINLEQQLGI